MGIRFNLDQSFVQLGTGVTNKLITFLQRFLSTKQIDLLRLFDPSHCHDDHEFPNGSSNALAACDSGKNCCYNIFDHDLELINNNSFKLQLTTFLGNAVISFIFAFFIAILFESPTVRLLKLFFSK